MRIKHSRWWGAGWAIGAAAVTLVLQVEHRRTERTEPGPEALEGLRREVARADADAKTWRQLARLLDRVGHTAHALEAWQRAVELDPFDAEGRAGLANALARAAAHQELEHVLAEWVILDAPAALRFLTQADATISNLPGYRRLLADARSQAVD